MAQPEDEKDPLLPNQVCVAIMDFVAQEEGDLSFQTGETISIVGPCEHLFWYIGRNSAGETGNIPHNFVELVQEETKKQADESQPPAEPSHFPHPPAPGEGETEEDYLPMESSKRTTAPTGQMQSLKPKIAPRTNPLDSALALFHEKEKKRRLRPGTLVMGSCPFVGQEEGDLAFNVYEEMTLLAPLEDLCWYYAQKADSPEKKGAIPITHVRLVYMSDDEDDEGTTKEEAKASHQRLYDDVNDFISQSGWFSYPGLAHGKPALQHVMAKKAKMSYELFMGIRAAIYLLRYRESEKLFVGRAEVLCEELCRHFECFDKKREEIREIDDELCHHTDVSGWQLTVWPLEKGQVLEVEWAKKIIEHDALVQVKPLPETVRVVQGAAEQVEGQRYGQNEALTFTTMDNFDTFWEWFSPN